MSYIRDMILFTSSEETFAMEKLNLWCYRNDERKQQFQRIATHEAGGTKLFTSCIYVMAGNHFPLDKFLDVFYTFGWAEPASVCLVIRNEYASIVQVFGGKILEVEGEKK